MVELKMSYLCLIGVFYFILFLLLVWGMKKKFNTQLRIAKDKLWRRRYKIVHSFENDNCTIINKIYYYVYDMRDCVPVHEEFDSYKKALDFIRQLEKEWWNESV